MVLTHTSSSSSLIPGVAGLLATILTIILIAENGTLQKSSGLSGKRTHNILRRIETSYLLKHFISLFYNSQLTKLQKF